ncbi:MAG TPA: VOC family protein [Acidimicrobiales bacterium]|nr:VOC family protein [Acidimicrobiales bacterium]
MDAAAERPRNPGLLELRVADDPEAWTAAGFTVDGDEVRIDPIAVRLTGRPDDGPRGITGWTVAGMAIADGSLDGLRTDDRSEAERAAPTNSSPSFPPEPEPGSPVHPNGTVGLDHVVVLTPDLDRTIAACEAAGLDLRRVRETTASGSPVRQAFFKLGPVVLEVVSGDVGAGLPAADAPATFWGLAIDVADLDETAASMGEGLGRIKTAVQRGRRIATIRTQALDISTAIAAMDHHADRTTPDDGR